MPLRRPWVLVVFTNACGVNFWIFLILDKKFTFLLNFVTYFFSNFLCIPDDGKSVCKMVKTENTTNNWDGQLSGECPDKDNNCIDVASRSACKDDKGDDGGDEGEEEED